MARNKMTCYYELLEVERDADDDTIKKSYRKLALKWHPDKNIDREEEAKQKFQLLQQAFEVLSDPQERAWYDRHREQILKGNQSNYEDNCLDVYAYFMSSCYKGFGDNEEGFYSVYRKVFEQISSEDIEYMDDGEFEKIPQFGNSKSDFDSVLAFYGYWESYSTKKSYAWLYTHNINEIRDRRVLKLVDKEHKKIQQKARKERNEEVRSLVLFVKKRDKRMIEYRKMLEEKAAQNRLKSQQNRLEQMQKRAAEIKEQQKNSKVHKDHQEQLQKLEEEYFNQYSDSEEFTDDDDIEDLENELGDIELEPTEEEIIDDELYCVACNKFFNSISSKSNHEASKKHKQNVELLKSEMNNEEEEFQKAQNGHGDKLSSNEEEEVDPQPSKSKGKKSKKKSKKSVIYEEPIESAHEADEIAPEINDDTLEIKISDDEDWSSGKKGKKAKPKGKSKGEKSKEVKIEEPVIEPAKEISNDRESDSHHCATCNQIFPSKNKLFAHLKSTNHSIYLGGTKSKSAEKVSSKKKK